jgi:predicted NUDIX family NTP pyrophosphohydrolase
MSKLSAGILLFRVNENGVLEVLIAHPGGPFWAKKDEAAWSIPKGEYLEGEDAYEAAHREFREELGMDAPSRSSIDLGEIKQSSGKRIRVWAIEGDLDASKIESNTFEMEWPPKSAQSAHFPEVDRATWEPIAVARRKLHKGQVEFLNRLTEALSNEAGVGVSEGTDDESSPKAQTSEQRGR